MKIYLLIIGSISCLKYLFIPAYFSTDFQVHRNWLAITKSLPLEKWYYDNTSVWTLDYPPFFAWLEYILSQLAVVIDPEMVKLNNIDYKSEAAIIFQRSSVILLDFVYYYGAYLVCSSFMPVDTRTAKLSSTNVIAFILLASNPGLLMVDHIHFQYNGFLSGLLFISIAHIRQASGNFLASAFWFAVLLNFKHIYLYVAPAYFVFLVVAYCGTEDIYNLVKRILHLGGIVLSVFAVSFAPFADHVLQVLSRLFPFQRGLCHAYWAPNLWAIYNVLDKALVTIELPDVDVLKTSDVGKTFFGNLIKYDSHIVLYSLPWASTRIISVQTFFPILFAIIRRRNSHVFLESVVACSLSSFLFGWHVHEKAILLPVLPLTILACVDEAFIKPFIILSITGHISLFPLLFTAFESVFKVLLVSFYTCFSVSCLSILHFKNKGSFDFLREYLNKLELFYLLGLVPVALHEVFMYKFTGLHEQMPFLPLLVMSFYCGIGIFYCWIILLVRLFARKKSKTE
nr:EOG090X06YP [Artemia franciscana]